MLADVVTRDRDGDLVAKPTEWDEDDLGKPPRISVHFPRKPRPGMAVPGIGDRVNDASSWVVIGPINFQPGEFAKLALALFFAAYLADNRELIAASTRRIGPLHIPELRFLLPITLAWGFAVAVMVAQKDLGSALLFFTLFTVMMWVATERAIYLIIGLALFAGAAFTAYRLFAVVQTRVDIWLDPWADPLDDGYQIVQSLFGLANGGILGAGHPGVGHRPGPR